MWRSKGFNINYYACPPNKKKKSHSHGKENEGKYQIHFIIVTFNYDNLGRKKPLGIKHTKET